MTVRSKLTNHRIGGYRMLVEMAVLLGLTTSHDILYYILFFILLHIVEYLQMLLTQVRLNVDFSGGIWLNLVSSGYIRLNLTKSYVVRRRAH